MIDSTIFRQLAIRYSLSFEEKVIGDGSLYVVIHGVNSATHGIHLALLDEEIAVMLEHDIRFEFDLKSDAEATLDVVSICELIINSGYEITLVYGRNERVVGAFASFSVERNSWDAGWGRHPRGKDRTETVSIGPLR